jgi:hypothetical protein
MIIKFEQYNEGVRHLMTPKSKEQLTDAVLNKINKNKKLGFFNPSEWGLKLFNYDGSHGLNDNYHVIQFISYDGRKWEITIDESGYFPLMIREMKRGIVYKGAFNFKEVEEYLIKRGLEKIINESIRDKMTGKSIEEIKPLLKNSINIILNYGFEYFPSNLYGMNRVSHLEKSINTIFEIIGASSIFMYNLHRLFDNIDMWENAYFSNYQNAAMRVIKSSSKTLDTLLTDEMKDELRKLLK